MLTEKNVQNWLNEYVKAWETYDPTSIAALFSENASYAYHPYDEPVRGRDNIVHSWTSGEGSELDAPGSWRAEYRPFMIDGDRAITTGKTSYNNGDNYWNMFVIRFDKDGKCEDFVEWFMKNP